MTDNTEQHQKSSPDKRASLLLPFDASEMLQVRLLPAEYARLLGVSKQSVSRWIRAGKINLGFDGRLNPQAATRELLRNSDLGRLRARLLVAAVDDMKQLRAAAARVVDLEAELARAQEDIAFYKSYGEDADNQIREIKRLMIESEAALRATPDTESWLRLVEAIESASIGDDEAQSDDAWLADVCLDDLGGLEFEALHAMEQMPDARSDADEGAGG